MVSIDFLSELCNKEDNAFLMYEINLLEGTYSDELKQIFIISDKNLMIKSLINLHDDVLSMNYLYNVSYLHYDQAPLTC